MGGGDVEEEAVVVARVVEVEVVEVVVEENRVLGVVGGEVVVV